MSLLSVVLQEAEKANTEEYMKQRDLLYPLIANLTEKVQLLSFALNQNFIETFHNFNETKSLEQLNYKNRLANIKCDEEEIQEELKKLRDKFDNEDEDLENSYKKLKETLEDLKRLCILVEGKKILDQADHEFGRYDYSKAILNVKKLKSNISCFRYKGDIGKALFNMISQAENQLTIYLANLSLEWEDQFSWSEKRRLMFLTLSLFIQQSDPILMQKILKTLYETNRLHAELGPFSQFFIDKLLHYVIRHNCDIFTEDDVGALVFNVKIDFRDESKPSYQTIFMNLSAIFQFLHTTLGSLLEEFITVFSECCKHKFFKKLIDECIRNNLPSCESSYDDYQNLVLELDSFNKFLIEIKFIEADKSPLNVYIDDTESILYNKKCDKLLYDVRNLMGESISYGILTVGSSSVEENESMSEFHDKDAFWDLSKPIFLPRCVISQNVKEIVTMIIEHLEESSKLPEKYREQLVAYIKDIAVMYQTIVPKKYKVNLENCPMDIALFFNNCFYLAHSLVGPPWKKILPAPFAHLLTTTLLESIQDLRVEGLEKISLYIHRQKDIIMNNIETTETLTWSYETFDQFDSSINKALNLMKDLKSSWYNILPTRMYELSFYSLIQALCDSIIHRIMSETMPVSEELVYMLAVRIEDTIEQILTLLKEATDYNKTISSWNKFTRMPQLLKGQLLELAELWKKSKELSQCYTCEEVRQIIKMRFPDNDYRLRILKEIQ